MCSKATKSLEVATEGRKVAEAEGQRITKMLAESREEVTKAKSEVLALQKAVEAQVRVRADVRCRNIRLVVIWGCTWEECCCWVLLR